MASGNGDSPDPTMHIDTVRFQRLLRASKESRELDRDYESGVALFLSCLEHGKAEPDCYLLNLSEDDARKLAADLNDHFAGRIDIANPGDNYGRE